MTILTVACCATLMDDANHLAMCLGESSADAQTYAIAGWQDAQGNSYAAACFLSESMAQDVREGPVQRPEWDTEELIDMTAAHRAQAALVIWDQEGDIPQAEPGKITVVGGMDGPGALTAMGLQIAPDGA